MKKGHEGHIIVKMNSLIDKEITKKLYEASMGGVKIELIVVRYLRSQTRFAGYQRKYNRAQHSW